MQYPDEFEVSIVWKPGVYKNTQEVEGIIQRAISDALGDEAKSIDVTYDQWFYTYE